MSRSEVSKRNELERGADVGYKTVRSGATVLLPVLPGNSTLLQGSSTMSSPHLVPRADHICTFSKVIRRLRSAQCTQSLFCSFSPEMVQAAPGRVEEVRRAALRKRVCQGLEDAAPIPLPLINDGEALRSGFPWGSSVAIGFAIQILCYLT